MHVIRWQSDILRRERKEHDIFLGLLKLSPRLEDRVKKASDQELHYIADMVCVALSVMETSSEPANRLTRAHQALAQTTPGL